MPAKRVIWGSEERNKIILHYQSGHRCRQGTYSKVLRYWSKLLDRLTPTHIQIHLHKEIGFEHEEKQRRRENICVCTADWPGIGPLTALSRKIHVWILQAFLAIRFLFLLHLLLLYLLLLYLLLLRLLLLCTLIQVQPSSMKEKTRPVFRYCSPP